jgi:hypothetical protein
MQYDIKIQKNLTEINIENEITKKIMRERFFGEFKENNFNLKNLIVNVKEDINNLGKFNFFLRMVKQNYHINIYDSILFLEDEGYDIKKLGGLLNSENKATLKTELMEKFRMKKVEPSILERFIIE